MTDEITPELFQHLANLGAFEVDSQEAELLRKELNNQLKSVRQLAAIPLEDDSLVETHGVSYTEERRPPLRSDEWEPCDNPEEILAQAQQVEDGYIIVPDIPHTSLEA